MVVDIDDGYIMLLSMDFFLKIEVVINIKWRFMQVWDGPCLDVHILLLHIVNMSTPINIVSMDKVPIRKRLSSQTWDLHGWMN